MEVHPQGSPISSQDSGRPGEPCGVGLSVGLAFYDITNHFFFAHIAIENLKNRGSNFRTCIEELHRGGVHLTDIPGMEQLESL